MPSLTEMQLEALRYAVPAVEQRVAETTKFLPSNRGKRLLAQELLQAAEVVQEVLDAYAHLTALRELAAPVPSDGFNFKRIEIAGNLIELEGFLIARGETDRAGEVRRLYQRELTFVPEDSRHYLVEARQELYAELNIPDPLAGAAA